jgi:hypothetical protein
MGAARCIQMNPGLYEDMLWTTSKSARCVSALPFQPVLFAAL